MKAPLVSVICPTFNRSERIVPTLQSVLDQLHAHLELIVVLDGCTDDTASVVRSISRLDRRVRAIETPGWGHPSEPRNIGIEHANGTLVAYIDHDDVWFSDHLSHLIDVLDDAEVAAAACDFVIETGETVHLERDHAMCWHPELQLAGPLFRPTQFIHRRDVVTAAGGWHAGRGLEDWDLLLRLSDNGCTFRTSRHVTSLAFVSETTRLSTVDSNFRIALASSSRRSTIQELRDSFHRLVVDPAMAVAARADVEHWMLDLRSTGQLVQPLPERASVGCDVRIVRIAPHDLWSAPVEISRQSERFVLEWPLLCTSVAHGERIESLLRRRRPRELAIVRDILERPGDIELGSVFQPFQETNRR